jgi:cobalt-precorrin 5A hydrolase/precorrin-3B C17-methyltransferase
MAIIRAHRPPTTLVGIARALGQAEESTIIAHLGELKPETIDMHTVLLIGNSQTRRLGHRMVNPRGYQVEA